MYISFLIKFLSQITILNLLISFSIKPIFK
jgi:hypothetical protein